MYTYSFEKLAVWSEARTFVKNLYILTSKFPPSEKYGLVSQLRRAAISVVSNIAEGSSRNTGKDRAQFYQIAYSSVLEVLNQLIISNDLEYINSEQLHQCRLEIDTICQKLAALRNSQLKS